MNLKAVDYAELFDSGQLKFHQECGAWGVVLIKNTIWLDCGTHIYFCLSCRRHFETLKSGGILTKDQFDWRKVA